MFGRTGSYTSSSYGNNSYGNNSYGNNSYGNNSYGNNSYGNNNNSSYGNNSYGNNSYGNNSYGNNSYGNNNQQKLGSYRVNNYNPKEISSDLTNAASQWKDITPLSISTRDETLHLSPVQLRIQDYYLIRTRNLEPKHQRALDACIDKKCFNSQLLSQQSTNNLRVMGFSNDPKVNLEEIRRNGGTMYTSSYGNRSYGNSNSYGNNSYGNNSYGNNNSNSSSYGNNNNNSYGNNSSSYRGGTNNNNPFGSNNNNSGGNPFTSNNNNSNNRNNNPFGNNNNNSMSGSQSYGNNSSYNTRSSSYGNNSYGNNSYGNNNNNNSYGNNSYSNNNNNNFLNNNNNRSGYNQFSNNNTNNLFNNNNNNNNNSGGNPFSRNNNLFNNNNGNNGNSNNLFNNNNNGNNMFNNNNNNNGNNLFNNNNNGNNGNNLFNNNNSNGSNLFNNNNNNQNMSLFGMPGLLQIMHQNMIMMNQMLSMKNNTNNSNNNNNTGYNANNQSHLYHQNDIKASNAKNYLFDDWFQQPERTYKRYDSPDQGKKVIIVKTQSSQTYNPFQSSAQQSRKLTQSRNYQPYQSQIRHANSFQFPDKEPNDFNQARKIVYEYKIIAVWDEDPDDETIIQGEYRSETNEKKGNHELQEIIKEKLLAENAWVKKDCRLLFEIPKFSQGEGRNIVRYELRGSLTQKKINLPRSYTYFPNEFKGFIVRKLKIINEFGEIYFPNPLNIENIDFSEEQVLAIREHEISLNHPELEKSEAVGGLNFLPKNVIKTAEIDEKKAIQMLRNIVRKRPGLQLKDQDFKQKSFTFHIRPNRETCN